MMPDQLDFGGFVVKFANKHTESPRPAWEIFPTKKGRCDEHGFDICQACMFHHERATTPSSTPTQESSEHGDWVVNQASAPTCIANSTEGNIFLNSKGEDERPLPLRLMKVAGDHAIGRDVHGSWSIAGPCSLYDNNPYILDGPPVPPHNANDYPVLEQYPLATQCMWGSRFLPQWDEQVNGLQIRREFDNIRHIPLIPNTPENPQSVPFQYCEDCQVTWLKGRDAENDHHHHHPIHGSLDETEAHASLVNHRSAVVSVAGCKSSTDEKAGGVGIYWGPNSHYNANREINIWDRRPMTKEMAELMAVYKVLGQVQQDFAPDLSKATQKHHDDEAARMAEEKRLAVSKMIEALNTKAMMIAESQKNKPNHVIDTFQIQNNDKQAAEPSATNESFSSGTLVSESHSPLGPIPVPASAAPTCTSFDFIPTPTTTAGFGTLTRQQKNNKGGKKGTKKSKKDKKKDNKKKAAKKNAHKRKVSSFSNSSSNDSGKDTGSDQSDREEQKPAAEQLRELKVSPKFAVETPFSLTEQEKEETAKSKAKVTAAIAASSSSSSSSHARTISAPSTMIQKYAVETPFALTPEEQAAIEKQAQTAAAAAAAASSPILSNKAVMATIDGEDNEEKEKETEEPVITIPLRLIIATDSEYLVNLFTRDLPTWTWDPEDHVYRRPLTPAEADAAYDTISTSSTTSESSSDTSGGSTMTTSTTPPPSSPLLLRTTPKSPTSPPTNSPPPPPPHASSSSSGNNNKNNNGEKNKNKKKKPTTSLKSHKSHLKQKKLAARETAHQRTLLQRAEDKAASAAKKAELARKRAEELRKEIERGGRAVDELESRVVHDLLRGLQVLGSGFRVEISGDGEKEEEGMKKGKKKLARVEVEVVWWGVVGQKKDNDDDDDDGGKVRKGYDGGVEMARRLAEAACL